MGEEIYSMFDDWLDLLIFTLRWERGYFTDFNLIFQKEEPQMFSWWITLTRKIQFWFLKPEKVMTDLTLPDFDKKNLLNDADSANYQKN